MNLSGKAKTEIWGQNSLFTEVKITLFLSIYLWDYLGDYIPGTIAKWKCHQRLK